jgi:glutaminase
VVTVEPITGLLEGVWESVATLDDGEVADYIPELAKADPSVFGMSVATIDGQVASTGELVPFTIQSVSKPFVYALALADSGQEAVLKRVGAEPTGDPFNSISLDRTGRAPNPMVNAGAMVTSNLVAGATPDERWARIISGLSQFAGRQLEVDETVFESERTTGDRNRAIAFLMRSAGLLGEDVVGEVDLYFRQCSVLVDSRDLAVMGATLANAGRNPLTGVQVVPREVVASVLTIMTTCGMYDYAGEWLYRVGLPAKSGVSGGVVAALPGQLGIGVHSPRLDERGNSVRGVAAADRLSSQLGLHLLLPNERARSGIRRKYTGAVGRSLRVRPVWEAALLDEHGGEISVIELAGDQGFTTAAEVVRIALADETKVRWQVLDLRRASRIDEAARSLFTSLVERLGESGIVTRVVEPNDLTARNSARAIVPDAAPTPSVDAALEWAEDNLLAEYGVAGQLADELVPLSEQELLRELDPEALAALEAAAKTKVYTPGTIVFDEGDEPDGLYFLGAGLMSVEIRDERTRRFRRINTIPAGAAFGELAVVDGGRRSTRIAALEPSVCHVLSLAQFEELAHTNSSAATQLSLGIARLLSARLRRSTAILAQLDSMP